MNRMSCINQHANISLINRRDKFPYSFYYLGYWFSKKIGGKRKNSWYRDLTGRHNISVSPRKGDTTKI
jgi:hypothetical protein